ncbi:serine hydrolase [Chryseotalea sanaruensis]|uniref:Serine hydrolase n=2 Tax=Chryseotalea sanaruensis TaxID=2482724 RepID=A0A401UDZ6_9BACT|nr:serine hydrolase [Chryseotalea sanaruensis]
MIMPIIAIICTLIFIPWEIVWTWAEPLPDTVQEQVNDVRHHELDGIIVYVNQQGKAPAFYAAGWMNKEKKVPANPYALFKIASISKLYIAAATAKLIANHQLFLNDTLSNLVPELTGRIENADKITLRMLLQHRSGIPDWIDDKEFPWGKPPSDVSQVLNLVLDEPAKFKPDKRHDYSNTNYLLIGEILDRKLGYDHQQYIKKEILDPLELTHTFARMSEVDTSMVVSGYDSHFKGDVKRLDFVSPGGSMIATAEDVGIFVRTLNDGSLLSGDEQKIYSSIYEYGHTGLLPGYQSIARYHKDIDAVVIQFVNTSGGNKWTVSESIYNRIIKILRKEKAEQELQK